MDRQNEMQLACISALVCLAVSFASCSPLSADDENVSTPASDIAEPTVAFPTSNSPSRPDMANSTPTELPQEETLTQQSGSPTPSNGTDIDLTTSADLEWFVIGRSPDHRFEYLFPDSTVYEPLEIPQPIRVREVGELGIGVSAFVDPRSGHRALLRSGIDAPIDQTKFTFVSDNTAQWVSMEGAMLLGRIGSDGRFWDLVRSPEGFPISDGSLEALESAFVNTSERALEVAVSVLLTPLDEPRPLENGGWHLGHSLDGASGPCSGETTVYRSEAIGFSRVLRPGLNIGQVIDVTASSQWSGEEDEGGGGNRFVAMTVRCPEKGDGLQVAIGIESASGSSGTRFPPMFWLWESGNSPFLDLPDGTANITGIESLTYNGDHYRPAATLVATYRNGSTRSFVVDRFIPEGASSYRISISEN